MTELTNNSPNAQDDEYSVDEDTSISISVLDNDEDSDGDNLTVIRTSNGEHGTVTINTDIFITKYIFGIIPVFTSASTFIYTPDENFSGSDTFSYTVSDGNGGEDTASVTIDVKPVQDSPVAGDDYASTDENTSVSISVLDNDTDPDNDELTVAGVTNGQYGTVVINNDNTITYTPDDSFSGSDTFSYTVSDGNGGEDTASVTIDVKPVQDPPVAVDDYASTDIYTSVTISVLDNDTDPDNDELTVAGVTNGQYGTVILNRNNTITYTPDDNFSGSDTFSYTVSDGNGGEDTASVTIDVKPVQDPPVAVDDYASTDIYTSVTISVLDNDTDPDDDTLTVTNVTSGQYGTVILNNDNTITYTPDANFAGIDALSYSDTFSYTVSDGNGGEDAANVTIEVGLSQDTYLYSMGMDDYASNTAGTGEAFQLTLPGVIDAVLSLINFVRI